MNARRATVKEPVPVEDKPVKDETPDEPVKDDGDEHETSTSDEEDVPSVPEDDAPVDEGPVKDDRTPEQAAADKEKFLAAKDEPEPEDEFNSDLDGEDWLPGQPCRVCGNPQTAWTNSFGRGCNVCMAPKAE